MKCGRCKGSHETVAEVKACYGVLGGAIAVEQKTLFAEPVRTPVPAALVDPDEPKITEKQESYLNKLLAARPTYRDVENLFPENVAKMSTRDASRKIDEVSNLRPEKKGTAGAGSARLTEILEGIEDCYLALPSKTGTNDLDFIRLGTNQGTVNPEDKGNRRIQRILGGQGPISIRLSEQYDFAEIVVAMTPEARRASMVLFGREIGRCGVCGKSLTDQISRQFGIGPICRDGGGF